MNIQDLKQKSSEQLIDEAEKLGIENASTLNRQEIYFAILKTLAEKGQDELEKLNYSDTKGLGFKDKKVNYANYKPFWKQYLEIEDIEASEYLIKNAVFHKMQPSNHNAIFKTAGKQNLSYS